MATQNRRAIGAAPAGAPAPAEPVKKTEDAMDPTDPMSPAVDPAPAAPDKPEIVPVDVNSADYIAGHQNALDGIDVTSENYKAGYAAGLGESGAATPADNAAPPADTTTPAGSADKGGRTTRAAKSYELVAAFPDDKGFVADYMAQCEQNEQVPTLTGAKAAYADVLAAKLKTERTAREKAEQALAAEQQSPPPVKTARASTAKPPVNPEDPKAVAADEWDNDPGCRGNFRSKDSYVAYRVAVLTGRHRDHSPAISK